MPVTVHLLPGALYSFTHYLHKNFKREVLYSLRCIKGDSADGKDMSKPPGNMDTASYDDGRHSNTGGLAADPALVPLCSTACLSTDR